MHYLERQVCGNWKRLKVQEEQKCAIIRAWMFKAMDSGIGVVPLDGAGQPGTVLISWLSSSSYASDKTGHDGVDLRIETEADERVVSESFEGLAARAWRTRSLQDRIIPKPSTRGCRAGFAFGMLHGRLGIVPAGHHEGFLFRGARRRLCKRVAAFVDFLGLLNDCQSPEYNIGRFRRVVQDSR